MMMLTRQRGFILIFALWVLGMLTVMAVSVAAAIRQKMVLIQKLDERSRMHYLLTGAAGQAVSYIRQQLSQSTSGYSARLKASLHDNPAVFSQIAVNNDRAGITYTLYDGLNAMERSGVVDEERKININTANVIVLQKLFERVLSARSDESRRLAEAVLDWRQPGESELTGFYSQDYYANLQYPFRKKDKSYDVLDELLLIKGMTKDIYESILPFITIYGDGRININTAPAQVLYAAGLEDSVIEKLLAVRRGGDGVEATLDDHVFVKTFDVAAEVNGVIRLEPQEMRSIDALNLQNILTSTSAFFTVEVDASVGRSQRRKQARAVYSATGNKILYWREK